ncbi:transporter [Flavobacterium sp. RSB2_4_14]|uniref:transporter n=1 Tax=Flavobacterium sp. RSB2_4_14 TaxID=3447665 RepID=UPI003F375D1E
MNRFLNNISRNVFLSFALSSSHRLFRPSSHRKKSFTFIIVILFSSIAFSQDLEPRVYANVPKNLNIVILGYNYLQGNVVTDPSLPIENFEISSHNFAAGYVKTFGLANKLARIQVVLPYTYMDGKVTSTVGDETTGNRSGLADMRIRFGVNLFGSPALERKDFAKFNQKTIFGASLVTSVPIGQYFKEKIVNLGTNRWAFKPEVGISRRFKSFYIESYVGVWFYTKNNEFLIDKEKTQKPALSMQFHSSYYFKNQMWIGFNANWYKGGSSTVDGVETGDNLDNLRIGATWSFPIAKTQSLKLQFHLGANKTRDIDYDAASLSYQYSFF